jgi:prepilin-type N-terminal cleavage/methylation domain-containing protein
MSASRRLGGGSRSTCRVCFRLLDPEPAMRSRPAFTLPELLAAVALLGVLSALSYPGLSAAVERERLRASIRLLVVDLHATRGEAARSGRRAALRFTPLPASPRCYSPRYQLVVLGPPEVVVRTRELPLPERACLDVGIRREVVFQPWGLLRGGDNRKIRVRSGPHADSLVISSVGRIHRY